MRIRQGVIGAVALLLASAIQSFAQPILPGGGGGTNSGGSLPPPVTRRNAVKYAAQTFGLLDTNAVAQSDPNLYAALAAIPADTNTAPVLQVAGYGDGAIIKASHFDFSTLPPATYFALVVCDNPGTPLYKPIVIGGSNSSDGWLVQGTVADWGQSDPLYMQVSNITTDVFFRGIPYSGPVVSITGQNQYDVVSNSIALQVGIMDLSGVTNTLFSMNVDGLPARYTVTAGNNITLDTHYSPNGLANIYANMLSAPTAFTETNTPETQTTTFSGAGSVALDFENPTFLAFASDNCEPEIGTNTMEFSVDKAQNITAQIKDPLTGQIVASYGGYVPYATTVGISWNMTQADHVTPYSNSQYQVTFIGQGPPFTTIVITNTIDKGGTIRYGAGCFLSYEYEDPTTITGAYLNSRADTVIGLDLMGLFNNLYTQFSTTSYGVGDIGANRNTPKCLPYNKSSLSWVNDIIPYLTNASISEFTIAQAHGSGGDIGGGYFKDVFTTVQLKLPIVNCQNRHNWRLRRASLWTCYSGASLLAGLEAGYPDWLQACGIRPTPNQNHGFMYKNTGLFFQGKLDQGPFGVAAGLNYCSAEAAQLVDFLWVCGKTPYAGACDPTYSFDWAAGQVLFQCPEMKSALPFIGGFPYCVYTTRLDESLKVLDWSTVNLY